MPKVHAKHPGKRTKTHSHLNKHNLSSLDLPIEPDPSLNEGIKDLFKLISKINKQTENIMEVYLSEDEGDSEEIDPQFYKDPRRTNYTDFDPSYNPNTETIRQINWYRDHISKLTAENRTLRRQLTGLKGNLNEDLTNIYEKLKKVQLKQNTHMTK